MSYTMQEVIDHARLPLNDEDKDRYKDTSLLAYAQTGLQLIRSRRPDLFFGQFSAEPDLSALTVADLFPLSDEYMQPVADFVTGRASTSDADHVVSQRYKAFMEMFGAAI